MGVWKATEEVVGAVEDNLATKISDVGTLASKTLDGNFDVFRRSRAESIWDQGTQTASVGVWIRQGQTGAASQTIRDWDMQVVIDYTYHGTDRTTVAEQVELATDAIMRVVDEIIDRDTIVRAGEHESGTVSVHDVDELVQESGDLSGGSPYRAAARVEFPLTQRETLT